jgi:signal transduction histidine kinase
VTCAFSHGIHPAVLTKGGLTAALARRSAVPVDIRLHLDRRLGERTDVAVYVVCEALTNAAKHAHASAAQVKPPRMTPTCGCRCGTTGSAAPIWPAGRG